MAHLAKVTIFFLVLLSLAGCASSPGQETASADSPESAGAANEQSAGEEASVAAAFDPVRCVRYTPSGTRISQKVCKKQSEWDRLKEQAQRSLGDVQRRAGHENQTL